MSAPSIPGLEGQAPTENAELLRWIAEVVELTQPDKVVFADGSEESGTALPRIVVE